MTDDPRFSDLDTDLRNLEETLEGTSEITRAFASELGTVKMTLAATINDLGRLENGFSRGLRKAFDEVTFDGGKLSDALSILATSMSKTVYNAAMKPVTDHFGGLLASGVNALAGGLMPFQQGGSFTQGRVMPFAKGGVVSKPVTFPMRGATGLMGEAGPEAIMPLSRSADGSLGVKASGTQTVNISMNISTPNVEGFRQSQSQILSSMSRALGRGQRNQ